MKPSLPEPTKKPALRRGRFRAHRVALDAPVADVPRDVGAPDVAVTVDAGAPAQPLKVERPKSPKGSSRSRTACL